MSAPSLIKLIRCKARIVYARTMMKHVHRSVVIKYNRKKADIIRFKLYGHKRVAVRKCWDKTKGTVAKAQANTIANATAVFSFR